MVKPQSREIIAEVIEKDKWTDFLKRFIDVLRINIFVVDANGRMLVPPYRNGIRGMFGIDFLTSSFGFDLSGQEENLIKEFEKEGEYLEAKDPFDFRTFAIPILAERRTLAYLIVGPVILNKRWEDNDYLNLAGQLQIETDGLVDAIVNIRVVSFVAMKSILDLLREVVKDVVEINLEKKRLHKNRHGQDVISKRIADVAEDMYARIHLDELLVTILDVALKLTKAECGSIMILDEKDGSLAIKVSRGINQDIVRTSQIKMGEGLAGLAAQNNEAFIISGCEGNNRIKHLLKRPEIKQSIVLPLSSESRVLGVLNLHTKSDENKIDDNISNIKHLSKLITTAINSI